jgi:hypothetical protein
MNIRVRQLNRLNLAEMFGVLGFKKGAEIGVRGGDYTEILCQNIPTLEKLYAIDPWDVVPDDPSSEAYGKDRQNIYYERAKSKLVKYPQVEIVRKLSNDAVKDIPFNSLDFVYIDGAHTFDYVMLDLIEWTKRVKPGGIVSGDDYHIMRHADVMRPVNAYCEAHDPKFLNIYKPKFGDPYPVPQWYFTKYD